MPNQQTITSPILVIGPGRSATTWVLNTLNAHPDVRDIVENSVLSTLHRECLDSWWSENWAWVCDGEEARRRTVNAARAVLCKLFPTGRPRWVMKMIWKGHPWDFVREVFPGAQYIHVTRHPSTCVASMMEHIGAKYPEWREQAFAEVEYAAAHEEALALLEAGVPYIRVRQEDASLDPGAVWEQLRAFLGLAPFDVPPEELRRPINVSAPDAGVGVARGVAWHRLSERTRRVAARLGYGPEPGVETGVGEGMGVGEVQGGVPGGAGGAVVGGRGGGTRAGFLGVRFRAGL